MSSVLSFKEGVIYTVKCMDLKCTCKSGVTTNIYPCDPHLTSCTALPSPQEDPMCPLPEKTTKFHLLENLV